MAYVHSLLLDLQHDFMGLTKRPIASIFIGGGTPSLLSAEAYEALFQGIQSVIPFNLDIEITLEANPGAVDEARFRDYRALGINRLSLGIQSFNPRHLKQLGRIHDGRQAHHAIESARHAGFTSINLDIMHGLPNQSVEEGLSDLRTALGYEPEHLSWYQLTIEPNTVFYKQQPILPDEEALGDLEDAGFALLDAHQFSRYEISAFCRPGFASQHNLNYWLFGDYLGIGAGAHGKLTSDCIERTRKHRQPTDYMDPNKAFLSEKLVIKPDELLFEFMLNTSRLQQPISHALLTERTGLTFMAMMPFFQRAADKGLLTLYDDAWQVTALGRRYANDLQALFLM